MRPAILATLIMGLFSLAGCRNYMWWDYRDAPYIAEMGKQGEQVVLSNINSIRREEREMALRLVADAAGNARRRGSNVEADRLEEIILRRYRIERDQLVRAMIIRICAPLVGKGSTYMPDFLRGRIAAGEYPGHAALALAALCPPNAFMDIEPLTRHPAPEIRYQAAIALTVLEDPHGFAAANQVWRGMAGDSWPEKVEGMPRAEARNALALRIRRAFGRPVF